MEKYSHYCIPLIDKMVECAIYDFAHGIPERHNTNTSKALVQRCADDGLPTCFRGDPKYLRSVYTAAYWFEQMQAKRDDLCRLLVLDR